MDLGASFFFLNSIGGLQNQRYHLENSMVVVNLSHVFLVRDKTNLE